MEMVARSGTNGPTGTPLALKLHCMIVLACREAAIEKSGMKIVKHEDLADTGAIPWYKPLEPCYTSLAGFAATPIGMKLTSFLTYTLETLRLAPKGAYASHCMLVRGGNALKWAGQQKLCTPMHHYVLVKPE